MSLHPVPDLPPVCHAGTTAISPDAVLWMVDDNPADLEIIGIVCEIIAYPGAFVPFTNGRDALERLHASVALPSLWPDVVLLDINMPSISGLAVLREIRHQPYGKDLPVVMFSTSSNEEEVARRDGATDYLIKPAALSDTVRAIRRVMEQFCKRLSA